MLLWGPPGTGKTTLARLVARTCDAEFVALSAVMAGVKDVRAVVEQAQVLRRESGRQTVLFLDEVHRFNKSQQDAFLPFVEDGTVCFIGATTENPSFEINSALLSRARVYVLRSLTADDVESRAAARARTRGGRGWRSRRDRSRGVRDPCARRGRRCATRAQPARDCARAGPRGRGHDHARRSLPRCRRAATGASTRKASSSTTRSRRCTRRCAAPIRMPRCTGSAACSTAAATRATSRVACCAWRPRTSAMPIRVRSRSRCRPAKRTSGSAAPRANSRSHRPSCSWRAPRRATPSMSRSVPRCRMRSRTGRSTCRCGCAMRRPA